MLLLWVRNICFAIKGYMFFFLFHRIPRLFSVGVYFYVIDWCENIDELIVDIADGENIAIDYGQHGVAKQRKSIWIEYDWFLYGAYVLLDRWRNLLVNISYCFNNIRRPIFTAFSEDLGDFASYCLWRPWTLT